MRHAPVDIGDKTMCSRCGNEILRIDEDCPSISDGEIYARGTPTSRESLRATQQGGIDDFQSRVAPWMMACFGPEISADKLERNDRFIEEALELVQASGYTKDRAHALVDYVFDRPQGAINQEVGGVMVTLAAHCLAHGVSMHEAAETELARIWTKVEQIRAKQAAKPRGSALPISSPPLPLSDGRNAIIEECAKIAVAAADCVRIGDGEYGAGKLNAARNIAIAVRALKSTKPGGE